MTDHDPPGSATVEQTVPVATIQQAPVSMAGVTRRFDDLLAVDDISLTVPESTIVGMIGPSGSGKTTAIRMLTGQLSPTSGQIRVLGEDPIRFRSRTREQIGYMPQLFVLYPELTAQENVNFVGSLFGMLWRRRHRRVREVLEVVDLWSARGRRASKMSGGMQRRLELACALVHEPALLFLDEPTAGIDPILRHEIWTELRRLREAGQTLLVTTQHIDEAEYCDLVALMAEGRLVAYGTPDALRRLALGGEVIEIETTTPIAGANLPPIPGVTRIRQQGPRNLLVVAADAGAVTPLVNEAVRGVGSDVASSREYRPPFDDVFIELVTRHARERKAVAEDGDRAAAAQERPN